MILGGPGKIFGALGAFWTAALVDFGRFYITERSAHMGRNPKTGDEKEITARNVISFYPSKTMKNKIS